MEEDIKKLKEYIMQDEIYQSYKNGTCKEFSDFDMFCINHCKSIENLLKEMEKKNKIIDLMTEHIDDLSEKLKLENEDISYAPCNDMETMNCCLEYECKDCIKQYFEKKVDEQICKD